MIIEALLARTRPRTHAVKPYRLSAVMMIMMIYSRSYYECVNIYLYIHTYIHIDAKM